MAKQSEARTIIEGRVHGLAQQKDRAGDHQRMVAAALAICEAIDRLTDMVSTLDDSLKKMSMSLRRDR